MNDEIKESINDILIHYDLSQSVFAAMYENMFDSSMKPWNTTKCIPTTWNNCNRCNNIQPKEKHVGIPIYNIMSYYPCAHLILLDEKMTEYQKVKNAFNQNNDELFIVKIYRSQNPDTFQSYMKKTFDYKKRLFTKDTINLYHTSKQGFDELISEGLDQRLSSVGLFGRGIYATSSPIKAASYWKGCNEIKTMFQVRMNLGNMYTFPNNIFDSKLLCPPRGFDSVQGNMTGNNEYIVYENDRCYIEYMIQYIHKNDLQRLIVQPIMPPTVLNQSGKRRKVSDSDDD